MSTLLLDTHVVHWWSAEPDRISRKATSALERADELAIADVTWFELAWLAQSQRIEVTIPIRTWLERLALGLRTIPIRPAIAASAVSLPTSFPGDPADRLIFATAVEFGWQLVSKDRRLREHEHSRPVVLW